MKCPKCKEMEHEPGAMFCHACGERIADTEQYIKYLSSLDRDIFEAHFERIDFDELTVYEDYLNREIQKITTLQEYATSNLIKGGTKKLKQNLKQSFSNKSVVEYITRKELNKWIIISSILAASIVGIPIALLLVFRNVIPMYKHLKTLHP